jgi:Kef-type K+ transport system membrane component KefB/nucleotide-binding universal stress UspA family protein
VSDTSEQVPDSGATARFGTGGRKRLIVMYVGLLATVAIVVRLLLGVGSDLTGPEVGDSGVAGSAGHGAEAVLWRLLLAILVILIAARLVGTAARRIRQPEVVGEIVAGILLGPSALGAIWPEATAFLFPEVIMPFLDVLANIGLIFFMFLVGLELDARLLRGRGHAAVWVSHASIIAPFLSGLALALLLFPLLGSEQGDFTSFALFLGAAMSVTAFPVLARILTERGLYKTKLGTVTLTCAAVDDVTAWSILAVVVTVARATEVSGALVTIALSLAFITAMLLAVRPLLQRLAAHHEERGRLNAPALAAIFGGVILSALITDRIGIHVIFGAFLAGAVMPQRPAFIEEVTEKMHDFSVLFLLPIFFAFSGIRTDMLQLRSPQLWGMTLLVVAVAVLGKWGGSTIAARMVHLDWRESSALGVLMNCRGLTELVILNIGLEIGVLPPAAFAMLVIMAIATTVMTEPLLALHYPRDLQRRMAAEEGVEEEAAAAVPERRQILVAVANPRTERNLLDVAVALARADGTPAQVVLLRVVELPASAYRVGPVGQESLVEEAAQSLRPLVAHAEHAGLKAVPLVLASSSVDETITRVAMERQVSLVLIGYHRGPFGKRLLGGTVGHILRSAKTNVAVLVAPPSEGPSVLPTGATISVPWANGVHEQLALETAIQLSRQDSGEVQLLGPSIIGPDRVEQVAADTYEQTGVWTTPVPLEGDIANALESHMARADMVVMGLSDRWQDKRQHDDIRNAVMERLQIPLLIVRRHVRGSERLGHLVRRRRASSEWINGTNGQGAPNVAAVARGHEDGS